MVMLERAEREKESDDVGKLFSGMVVVPRLMSTWTWDSRPESRILLPSAASRQDFHETAITDTTRRKDELKPTYLYAFVRFHDSWNRQHDRSLKYSLLFRIMFRASHSIRPPLLQQSQAQFSVPPATRPNIPLK